MTRHRSGYGSFIAAIFTLALIAATAAAYWAASLRSNANRPTPTPNPSVERHIWSDIAQASLDHLQTDQTMLTSAHVTGQPTGPFLADCRTAVADYNRTAKAAGPDWPPYLDYPLNPDQECQAPR